MITLIVEAKKSLRHLGVAGYTRNGRYVRIYDSAFYDTPGEGVILEHVEASPARTKYLQRLADKSKTEELLFQQNMCDEGVFVAQPEGMITVVDIQNIYQLTSSQVSRHRKQASFPQHVGVLKHSGAKMWDAEAVRVYFITLCP